MIDILTESTIEYMSAQADAGAQVLKIFDSWAGVLSPRLFDGFVTKPTQRIAEALRARHPSVPLIGFPRLAGLGAGAYAKAAGLQGVAFETGADLTVALPLVPDGIATQGNLDPMALVAGGRRWKRRRARCWRRFAGAAHLQPRARHRATNAAGARGRAGAPMSGP